MKFARILARIRSTVWAVTPSTLTAIADVLSSAIRDQSPRTESQAIRNSTPAQPTIANGTAVIPVHGIMGKNLSLLETECGGCDVDSVGTAIDVAANDPAVANIVLDIDSPGGAVTGIPELRAKIAALAERKKVIAFTGSEMCSAAYWLATGADGIVCSPSAILGSIGVYVAMVDESAAWEKQGLKLELVKAGEFKAAGIPGKPLAARERALVQADVDSVYEMFSAAVRDARSGVSESVMQGQVFRGTSAVAAGLADDVVADLPTLLAALSPRQSKVTMANAATGRDRLAAIFAADAAQLASGAPPPRADEAAINASFDAALRARTRRT